MAFKMKAGSEGPFKKNFPSAFKDRTERKIRKAEKKLEKASKSREEAFDEMGVFDTVKTIREGGHGYAGTKTGKERRKLGKTDRKTRKAIKKLKKAGVTSHEHFAKDPNNPDGSLYNPNYKKQHDNFMKLVKESRR